MIEPARAAASHVRRRLGRLKMRARRLTSRALVSRHRMMRSGEPVRNGVTVATVNWNSLPYLKVLIEAVQKFSGPDVDLLVVDNHSSDGTSEFLEGLSGVRCVQLPFNVGHGYGCDVAMLHAATTDVVILDVDAFPISEDWLAAVLGPLDEASSVAGAHVHRSFIHPCFLAMRRGEFLDLGVSFAPVGFAPKFRQPPKGVFMDVAESLCHAVALTSGSNALHRIPATSVRGPGMAGTVFGDVVYHNFYSTQGDPDHMSASRQLWSDAVETYLR